MGLKYYLESSLVVETEFYTLSVLSGMHLPKMFVLELPNNKNNHHQKPRIPGGIYPIQFDFSRKFQAQMPYLLDVLNYNGIMFHVGNSITDTRGCLLVGYSFDFTSKKILNSRDAFNDLVGVLKLKSRTADLYIKILR